MKRKLMLRDGARTVARAVTTAGRAVRRLPVVSLITPLGAAVLVLSLGAWLTGTIVGWGELFLASSFGLLTFAACGLFVISRAQPAVEIVPQRRRFTAGESITVEVLVTNDSSTPMLPVDLEIVVGASQERFSLPTIGGHAVWREGFPVVGARRSVITIGPATTVRGDPFGLLQRRVRWADTSELFVHPVTIPLPPLGSGLLRDLEGRATSELSASDLAFHALREYAPGDDRRFIHWRSSAKAITSGGTLMVRQFEDTRRTQLLVVVDGDQDDYANPEEFELAISAGASVTLEAVREELDVTLLVADQQVTRRGVRRVTSQLVKDACSRAAFHELRLPEQIGSGVRVARDVSFAVLVTGSRPDFPRLRRSASLLPRHVRTSVLRVVPGQNPAISPGASVSVLTMGKLDDLRGLMSRGVKA